MWAGVLALVLELCASMFGAAATAARPQAPRTAPDVGLTLLDDSTADVAWSRDGKWMAYPKRDPLDLYMKIWIRRSDGSPGRCLTCDPPAPAKHCGGVAWDPSGEFLLFSAENDDVRTRKADRLAEPGFGLNTNLWAMTVDGAKAWPLTHDETDDENPRGVVHPVISPDGAHVVWSGPVARNQVRPGYEWGEWALYFADIDFEGAAPALRNVHSVQPGDQHSYYESYDWSPDGRFVLFGGNLVAGQPVNGLDLYEYEVATGTVKRLTRSANDWDEDAHYSADGRAIYWGSSRGLNVKFRSLIGLNWTQDIKTEFWVMKRDGTDARRVTWFNEPGWRDFEWFRQNVGATKRVFVSNTAINPETTRAAMTLQYENRQGQLSSALVLLELDRRRPDWQAIHP